MKVVELTFEDFLVAKVQWNDALQRSIDNHIFLTWEWLSTWWKHYGHRRNFILTTVNDSEEMLAAAALMSSKYRLYGLELRKIEFIGTPASDYHSLLLTANKSEYTKMMLEHVNRVETEWDCFELKEIPENSESARVLRTISKDSFRFKERTLDPCPFVSLPRSFEDYLRSLGSNWRRNLRRWERKLSQNYKVDFYILNDLETVNESMKIIFDLHQKRWLSRKQRGAFSDRRFRDFHLDIAKSFGGKGWLTLNYLTLNGEPVAGGYAFRYAQKLYCYLSGFDPQYSEYHVGHLRHIYLIKNCIENGLKEYDFLRGEESYKSRWSAFTRKNIEVRVIKRKIVPILYDLITKNDWFYPLTSKLGERLSLG